MVYAISVFIIFCKVRNIETSKRGSTSARLTARSSLSIHDTADEGALRSCKSVFAERSVFTPEYQMLLRHLRQARSDSGLTQVQLGERLGQPQAIISKCERGERRLDVIELRAYCAAMGVNYLSFLTQLEIALGSSGNRRASDEIERG